MNKQQLTKTFSFSKWLLFFFFAIGLTLTSCGEDYDDDIKRLEGLIQGNTTAIKDLKGKVDEGKFVTKIEPITGGIKVTLTDASFYEVKVSGTGTATTVEIKDGVWFINGVTTNVKATGENGAPGTPGQNGISPSIINGTWWIGSVNTEVPASGGGAGTVTMVDQGDGNYKMTIIKDGNTEEFLLPKATTTIVAGEGTTGIKFVPSVLSPGEAARIHFPVIVSDTIVNHLLDISTWDYIKTDWESGRFRDYGILYSGKGEFTYQMNPNSLDFGSFEVLGFTRSVATIWDYNTNDLQPMLFDKGQAWYTDGKLTPASYPGFGVLQFRAKDWGYAELHDQSQRNVYSLVVKNNDKLFHSDFIPAKFEPILEKNVYLAKKESDATKPLYTVATAPNTWNYRPFIVDKYLRTPQQYYTPEAFLAFNAAQKQAVQDLPENQHYLDGETASGVVSKEDPRIHYEVIYNDAVGVDMKKDIFSFFNKRVGIANQAAEFILEQNGFDDYILSFEEVPYYYDGVDQTGRYLNKESLKNGVAKVNDYSVWAGTVPGNDHTASIGRTPIVRVKLIAPGEDNNRVVKTAIIKIHIVGKTTVKEVNYVADVTKTLMHIDQPYNIDMDPIFNAEGIKMSKDEFRDTYQWQAVNNDAYYLTALPSKTDRTSRKDDVSLIDESVGTAQYNQLVLTVKNTSFQPAHVVYQVKGQYVPKAGKYGPIINITYNVKVEYPKVVAPEKTEQYWVDAAKTYAISHGRQNRLNAEGDFYEMASDLSNMFFRENDTQKPYKPYGTQVINKDWARATLSFELIDMTDGTKTYVGHNNASNVADGENSGIRVYMRTDGHWEIGLEPTNAGRFWINPDGIMTKKIRLRTVISFNECVDGLYGTCSADADAHHKYSKVLGDLNEHKAGVPQNCDIINGDWTALAPAHDNHTSVPQDYAGNAGVAPEEGRSTIVGDPFYVIFQDPMVFHPKEVKPLYDKYPLVENVRYLDRAFFLADYLWAGGTQAQYQLDHIVYNWDKDLATPNPYLDANGWADKTTHPTTAHDWVKIFDIPTALVDRVHFDTANLRGRYLDAAGNETGIAVELVNMAPLTILPNNQITWDNGKGTDISKAFNVYIPVCVLHRWGQICNHSWNPSEQWGHSIGEIKLTILKYNGGF